MEMVPEFVGTFFLKVGKALAGVHLGDAGAPCHVDAEYGADFVVDDHAFVDGTFGKIGEDGELHVLGCDV